MSVFFVNDEKAFGPTTAQNDNEQERVATVVSSVWEEEQAALRDQSLSDSMSGKVISE